ncbi:serine/threonine protein kinase, partial [bacterium]|nr:serine/threonine protein kinase [bacterium]
MSELNSDLLIERACDRYESTFRAEGKCPNIATFIDSVFAGSASTVIGNDPRPRLECELLGLQIALNIKAGIPIEVKQLKEHYPSHSDHIELEIEKCLNSERSTGVDVIGKAFGASAFNPGQNVGNFELVSHLGTGGMGMVWKAKQLCPVVRDVALKFIRSQFAPDQLLVRFQIERQALAALNHANIARVYDAGVLEAGQPYFAMELVNGKRLTEFADDLKLGIDERLELFTSVCRAVEHAHQRGIIHRDLKPSNILVSESGEPKVIDFGLAKAMDSTHLEGDFSIQTQAGQVVGTLDYMSPEQTQLGQSQVDTRSDVYSLGAVLYELLSRHRIFAKEGLKGLGVADAATVIRSSIPQRPGAVVNEPANQLPYTSLPRDLDWITLKCLEKDAARRYSSVTGLIDDIDRFRTGQPVKAVPPSLGYRIGKFVKRNKATAVLASALAAMLAIGFALQQRSNREWRSKELVSSLVDARSEAVLPLIDQLGSQWERNHAQLQQFVKADGQTAVDRQRRTNSLLALAHRDDDYLRPACEEAFNAELTLLPAFQSILARKPEATSAFLWEQFQCDRDSYDKAKLRAGLILAGTDPNSQRWSSENYEWLAGEIIAQNPESQPLYRKMVQPIRDRLLPAVTKLIDKPTLRQSEQLSVANAIADFSTNRAGTLTTAVLRSNPDQFAILYPKLEVVHEADVLKTVSSQISKQPSSELLEPDRVSLGRQRANAAIVALRFGEIEQSLKCLEVTDDFEAATQFAHRCKSRGVTAAQLVECVHFVQSTRDGSPQTAKTVQWQLYSLMLALGKYPLEEVGDDFARQVASLYEADSAACIHSAAGWLLSVWGMSDIRQNIDHTEVPYSHEREWFTIKADLKFGEKNTDIDGKNQPIYVTMIVFPGGDFISGSPKTELTRQPDE